MTRRPALAETADELTSTVSDRILFINAVIDGVSPAAAAPAASASTEKRHKCIIRPRPRRTEGEKDVLMVTKIGRVLREQASRSDKSQRGKVGGQRKKERGEDVRFDFLDIDVVSIMYQRGMRVARETMEQIIHQPWEVIPSRHNKSKEGQERKR